MFHQQQLRREPSAYNTPIAREDLPEPDTPAIPTIFPNGISTSIFLRLWTFAPRISIFSIIGFTPKYLFQKHTEKSISQAYLFCQYSAKNRKEENKVSEWDI